jgi:hypothetical protein
MLPNIRKKNKLLNITGLLLYTGDNFFQVLEGDVSAIHTIFNNIIKDNRHTDVTLIIEEPICKREFDQWSMGFYYISAEQLTEISRSSDLLLHDTSLVELDDGRTKKILKAFLKGHWRI